MFIIPFTFLLLPLCLLPCVRCSAGNSGGKLSICAHLSLMMIEPMSMFDASKTNIKPVDLLVVP